MNAPLLSPPRPMRVAGFDLNAAHMEAHRWVEIARPLIVAYLALDQIQGDVKAGSYDAGAYGYDVRKGAADIADAMKALLGRIEGIRDSRIADLSPPAPNWGRNLNECSPEVIDYDDLCDMWAERCADVATVDAAIDREARS
jgi:hypothetical protein